MKPYLRNMNTGALERAVRRRLAGADIPALLLAQRAVTDALVDDSLYVPSSGEDFERVVREGELWGVFAGGRLAAAAALLPPSSGDGIADDLDLAGGSSRVAELDSYFVHPEYRRNGLGGELVRFVKRRAFAFGAAYLAATVSPRNTPSIFALVSKGGLRVICARLKYGGKLRYIALAARDDSKTFTVFERYAIDDVYGITKQLARGGEGCAVYSDEDGEYLWVAK